MYNAELAPNILENMNSGEVTVNYEKYFCTSPATGADIFTNCKGAEPAQVTFGFGLSSENLEDPEPQMQDNTQDVAKYIPIYKVDVTKYYDVYNVGSRATYGRFKKDGSSCEGGFEFNNGTGGDYCYEFYQSAKQFFVQGPDGVISTTARADNNQTILSTDGRVYPVAITTPPGKYPFYVTFANIGQFNESGSLGRLMGGGDGKAGVMQGEYGDTQVCFYEVCKIDDPECGEYCTTDDGTKKSITQCLKTGKSRDECEKEAGCNTQCASIAKGTQCKNGNIADTLNFSEDKYFSCLNTLLDQQEDCCSYVDEYMVLRNNTTLKPGVYEKYMKKCDVVKECQSFTLISSDYFNDTANLTDLTSINNSGALQVNARAVSLYNLFSNSENEMGINWQGENKTITHIQEIGDGIFGDTDKYLQYHVVMDNDCAKEISSYNRQEAGGDYGNGGFNDYTGKITDANINEFDPNWKENGQDAAMSKEFYNILKDHCSLDGNAATGESPVAPENNNRWDDKEITVVDK